MRYVGPCHCSGDAARQLFKKEYCENFINVGVGRVITMDDLSGNRDLSKTVPAFTET